MQSNNSLLLFRFTQDPKPLLLMLVDNWTKIVRGLPPRFCDFYQYHAPIRWVWQSPYIGYQRGERCCSACCEPCSCRDPGAGW